MATDRKSNNQSASFPTEQTGISSSAQNMGESGLSSAEDLQNALIDQTNEALETYRMPPQRYEVGKCAQQLIAERELKKLTKEQLAAEIGVPVSMIEDWENGLSDPNLDFRQKLSDFFQKDICD
jgi:ribosome-binding protein aMBF1 (putative translation factor)